VRNHHRTKRSAGKQGTDPSGTAAGCLVPAAVVRFLFRERE
jgi:hypothetical protein